VKGNQPTEIKLYRTRRILKYRKQYKSGKWAKWPTKDFKIGSTSKLPPAIYLPIWYNLRTRLASLIEDGQSFKRCSGATTQRLKYWGKQFTCTTKTTDHGLLWDCLADKSFIEFLVLDITDKEVMTYGEALDYLKKSKHSPGRRFKRLENDSKAMFRIAILIFKDEAFWLLGKTLPKVGKQ
jgi:hypothetical protein